MNSSTYQQSGDFNERYSEADPEMKLLWRFPRRRLSAEEIRDSMLFVSGELDQEMGSSHPFPPEDQWNFTQHAPFYGLYQTKHRSIYLMQQRLKKHPFLSLFDGADPNVSTPDRILTTVPTQTLYLMNDPFVHKCSGSFARKVLLQSKDTTDSIRYIWLSVLSRYPTDVEIDEAGKFFSDYQGKLKENHVPEEKLEDVAMSCLIRTLFTRNEFLFVE